MQKNKIKGSYFLVMLVTGTISIFLCLLVLFQKHSFISQLFDNCTPQVHAIKEPIFHHVLKPCSYFVENQFIDRSGAGYSLESKIKVSINSLGFRNISYSLKKAKDVRRIVLLGDSFVYGYALDLEDTFFKKLEIQLNKSFAKKIEVWNIGVASWSTIIQYLVIRNKIKYYSPDLLILLLDNSDYFDNAIYERYAKYDKSGALESILATKNDYFYQQRKKLAKEVLGNGIDCDSKSHLINLFTKTVKYLKKIDTLAKKMKVPFVVVNYPYPHQPQKYHQKCLLYLRREIAANDILFFDITPKISEVEKKTWYFYKSNLHWNERGSIQIANILKDFITQDFYKELE